MDIAPPVSLHSMSSSTITNLGFMSQKLKLIVKIVWVHCKKSNRKQIIPTKMSSSVDEKYHQ